jgi:hypothetical protein
VPILRVDDIAIALGHSQHAHHHIFGDGDRVDPGAVGNLHPARLEQGQRHAVHTGIDGIQPFKVGGRTNRFGHIGLVVHVEPADIGKRRKRHRLILGHEPTGIDIGRKVRLDQRPDKRGHNGDGHDGKNAPQRTQIKKGRPIRSARAMLRTKCGRPAHQ